MKTTATVAVPFTVAIPNDRSRSLKRGIGYRFLKCRQVAIPNDRSRSLKLYTPWRVNRHWWVAIPNDRSRSLKRTTRPAPRTRRVVAIPIVRPLRSRGTADGKQEKDEYDGEEVLHG